MKYIKRDSKQVDNNKDIRIPVITGEKVVGTTLGVKLAIGKLLMVSTKVVLMENRRDVSIRKV